jgi:hypothetical protein
LPARSFLADVNLWLATVVEAHPHHAAAMAWWRDGVLRSGSRVAMCRLTQLGLVRLLTNEQVMGPGKRSNAQAWAMQRQLLEQRNVAWVAAEPAGMDAILDELAERVGSSASFWSDAYLVALARAADMTLASFDRGYRRFPRLSLNLLG